MKELTVGVFHHGCWGSASAKAFPEVLATVIGPITVWKKENGIARVFSAWNIKAPDKKTLDGYFSFVKNHPTMKKYRVFSRTNTTAFAASLFESNGSSYDAVINSNSLYVGPVVQENAYEKHQVLTKNPNSIKKLLNELEILGEVKVLKIAKPTEEENPFNLTEKQFLALRVARQNGYYSWPRKATLEELAASSGFTRRAFQENLRKAEAKVLPKLLNKEVGA